MASRWCRRAPARADLGIGVITGPRHAPWDADAAARPDVVHVLLTALPEARRVGLLCTRLEGTGALTGGALGLFVPRPGVWTRVRLVTDTVTVAGTPSPWSSRLLPTAPDAGGRGPRSRGRGGRGGVRVALAVVVTVPGLSHFFGSRPLGPMGWTIALASAAGSVALPAAVRRAVPEKRIPESGSSPSGNLGAASRKP